jgi:hypothetical protein
MERAGDRFADTTGSAGDKGLFAGQVEHGSFLFRIMREFIPVVV